MGGRSWVNKGTLTIASDERIFFGYFTGGTNTLTNAVGATIELASTYSTPLDFYTGSASITDLGTLNQSVTGSHAISGSIAFNNGGTVNVNAGTLAIGGGGTDTGVYAVAAGAELNFAGGTRDLVSGSDVSGAGSVIVSGGTVNANGSFSIAGSGASLSVSGGTLNVNGGAASGQLVSTTLTGGVELEHGGGGVAAECGVGGRDARWDGCGDRDRRCDGDGHEFPEWPGSIDDARCNLGEHGGGGRVLGCDGREIVGEQGDADDRE